MGVPAKHERRSMTQGFDRRSAVDTLVSEDTTRIKKDRSSGRLTC
jgi:hypothetical protein